MTTTYSVRELKRKKKWNKVCKIRNLPYNNALPGDAKIVLSLCEARGLGLVTEQEFVKRVGRA